MYLRFLSASREKSLSYAARLSAISLIWLSLVQGAPLPPPLLCLAPLCASGFLGRIVADSFKTTPMTRIDPIVSADQEVDLSTFESSNLLAELPSLPLARLRGLMNASTLIALSQTSKSTRIALFEDSDFTDFARQFLGWDDKDPKSTIRAFRSCLYLDSNVERIMGLYRHPFLIENSNSLNSSYCFSSVLKLYETLTGFMPIPSEMRISAALFIARNGESDYQSVLHDSELSQNLQTSLYYIWIKNVIGVRLSKGGHLSDHILDDLFATQKALAPMAVFHVYRRLFVEVLKYPVSKHLLDIIRNRNKGVRLLFSYLRRRVGSDGRNKALSLDHNYKQLLSPGFYTRLRFQHRLNLLLLHGLDINTFVHEEIFVSIYTILASRYYASQLSVMLRHGLDVVGSKVMETILHQPALCIAAFHGNVEGFRLLLQYGASPAVKCRNSPIERHERDDGALSRLWSVVFRANVAHAVAEEGGGGGVAAASEGSIPELMNGGGDMTRRTDLFSPRPLEQHPLFPCPLSRTILSIYHEFL